MEPSWILEKDRNLNLLKSWFPSSTDLNKLFLLHLCCAAKPTFRQCCNDTVTCVILRCYDKSSLEGTPWTKIIGLGLFVDTKDANKWSRQKQSSHLQSWVFRTLPSKMYTTGNIPDCWTLASISWLLCLHVVTANLPPCSPLPPLPVPAASFTPPTAYVNRVVNH